VFLVENCDCIGRVRGGKSNQECWGSIAGIGIISEAFYLKNTLASECFGYLIFGHPIQVPGFHDAFGIVHFMNDDVYWFVVGKGF